MRKYFIPIALFLLGLALSGSALFGTAYAASVLSAPIYISGSGYFLHMSKTGEPGCRLGAVNNVWQFSDGYTTDGQGNCQYLLAAGYGMTTRGEPQFEIARTSNNPGPVQIAIRDNGVGGKSISLSSEGGDLVIRNETAGVDVRTFTLKNDGSLKLSNGWYFQPTQSGLELRRPDGSIAEQW